MAIPIWSRLIAPYYFTYPVTQSPDCKPLQSGLCSRGGWQAWAQVDLKRLCETFYTPCLFFNIRLKVSEMGVPIARRMAAFLRSCPIGIYPCRSVWPIAFSAYSTGRNQCCPKRFSIKTKKGSKAKVEITTLAKSTTSFTSYGKYNTFRTSNR